MTEPDSTSEEQEPGYKSVGELPFDPNTGFPKRNPKVRLVRDWTGLPALRFIDVIGVTHIIPISRVLRISLAQSLGGLGVIQTSEGYMLTQHKFEDLELSLYPYEFDSCGDDEDDLTGNPTGE